MILHIYILYYIIMYNFSTVKVWPQPTAKTEEWYYRIYLYQRLIYHNNITPISVSRTKKNYNDIYTFYTYYFAVQHQSLQCIIYSERFFFSNDRNSFLNLPDFFSPSAVSRSVHMLYYTYC